VGAFESRTKRNYFLAKTPWPKAADFAIMFRRCVQREQLREWYPALDRVVFSPCVLSVVSKIA
jgi:hypothetical protein